MLVQIAIVLFDGFDNLDAVGPFEVFGHARARGADIEVGLYTLDGQTPVVSGHGLAVQSDGVLPVPGPETGNGNGTADDGGASTDRSGTDEGAGDRLPDLVVVPGGGWVDTAETGVRAAVEDRLPGALARLHERGVTVASVCTGGMILAAAGLTDGRPAVTHHGAIEDLRASGADVVDARVIDDGDIVTADGVTSGLDLALYLLEREFGPELAADVAETMAHERRGPVSTPGDR
ncbi:MAG: putative transcriptional regulator [halophilic archaeon J07HX64]|nr:MAG: putative transcriptional regulator [halophilic archaeon J07HX64]